MQCPYCEERIDLAIREDGSFLTPRCGDIAVCAACTMLVQVAGEGIKTFLARFTDAKLAELRRDDPEYAAALEDAAATLRTMDRRHHAE
jgi:hypothetical protein